QNDAAIITGTPALNGILAGDEPFVSLDGVASGVFQTVTAGVNKPIILSGLSISGSASGNYNLNLSGLTATINPLTVTIENAEAQDKNFDGTTIATITGTLSGVLSPDTVTLNLSGVFNDSNVGNNKPVTSTSTLTGTDALNYVLQQPTGLTASILAGPCLPSSGIATWNFNIATPSANTTSNVTIS
ncbi:YDG domain-containing protein, partial [Microcystis aeruginosa]|uniref:YDG domain-containing protein n=1 Tax=Microcystis aeruginosa TaxID=1126 RepID=UPI001B8C80BB